MKKLDRIKTDMEQQLCVFAKHRRCASASLRENIENKSIPKNVSLQRNVLNNMQQMQRLDFTHLHSCALEMQNDKN